MFFRKYLDILKSLDWILFGAVFLLISFGLAALYSIAISNEIPDFVNFKKQEFLYLIPESITLQRDGKMRMLRAFDVAGENESESAELTRAS